MRDDRRVPADDGFTLVEVIMSIAVISIVIGAVASFFVSTTSLARQQGGQQTAVQLAADAVEQARKLDPASLVSGRDQQSVDAQWANPITGVDLSDMQEVYDGSAVSGAGASATLPTTYLPKTLDHVNYKQYWYVGRCWQPKGGGACTTSSSYAEMYRVIVAVTWTDNRCTANSCRYVASTLVSSKYPDPLFNVNGS